jgi:predicted protein tyrosine phosphatase
LLSFLGPNSPDPPELAEFAPHRRLILRFHDVIEAQPGQIAPTREDVERFLIFDREVSKAPEAHMLVHCRAGVSRSTAAATLILIQAHPEWPASAALDAVVAIRPRAWPNLLILEFGDAVLGRSGEIVAAAGAIYRGVLARDPKIRRPDDGRRSRPRGKRRLPRDRLILWRVSRLGPGPVFMMRGWQQSARPSRSPRDRRRSAINTSSSHSLLAGEPSIAGHEQRRLLLRLSPCQVAKQPDFVEPLSCLVATL